MSYSLKKIYEFKSTFNDKNVDLKSIKSLNEEIQLLDTLQIKTITLPNFGTFDLNTVQIGIIACLNEFYFGNKQLVQNIINRLYNEDIYNQRSQISLAASLDYSLKNINRLTESKTLTKEFAVLFLKECIEKKLIDNNYKIKVDSIKKVPPDYQIESSFGFLLEAFFELAIATSFKAKPDSEFIDYSCNAANVKYIVSILCVIYSDAINDLEDYFLENNTAFINNKLLYLYNHKFNKEKLVKEINSLVDESIKNNIEFKFQFAGSLKERPVDLIVKHENKLIAMLDVKSSYKTTEFNQYEISKSKDKVNKQINKIIEPSKDKKKYPDFNIGNINIAYNITKNKIEINSFNCIYQSYFNEQGGHNAVMKTVHRRGRNEDKFLQNYKLINNYCKKSTDKSEFVIKDVEYVEKDFEYFSSNDLLEKISKAQLHYEDLLSKLNKIKFAKKDNYSKINRMLKKHINYEGWSSVTLEDKIKIINNFINLKDSYEEQDISSVAKHYDLILKLAKVLLQGENDTNSQNMISNAKDDYAALKIADIVSNNREETDLQKKNIAYVIEKYINGTNKDKITNKIKQSQVKNVALKKYAINKIHEHENKSLDKNSFDRGRDKLLREVYHDLFREDQ